MAHEVTAKAGGVDSAVTVHRAEVVPAKDERALAAERILGIENQLLAESLEIVADVQCFREIGPEDTEPPAEWVEELGPKRAREKFRVAKAAWLPVKDAPVAIKTATQMAVGILKTKAMDRANGRNTTFNAVVVNIPGEAMQAYPRREVEK